MIKIKQIIFIILLFINFLCSNSCKNGAVGTSYAVCDWSCMWSTPNNNCCKSQDTNNRYTGSCIYKDDNDKYGRKRTLTCDWFDNQLQTQRVGSKSVNDKRLLHVNFGNRRYCLTSSGQWKKDGKFVSESVYMHVGDEKNWPTQSERMKTEWSWDTHSWNCIAGVKYGNGEWQDYTVSDLCN